MTANLWKVWPVCTVHHTSFNRSCPKACLGSYSVLILRSRSGGHFFLFHASHHRITPLWGWQPTKVFPTRTATVPCDDARSQPQPGMVELHPVSTIQQGLLWLETTMCKLLTSTVTSPKKQHCREMLVEVNTEHDDITTLWARISNSRLTEQTDSVSKIMCWWCCCIRPSYMAYLKTKGILKSGRPRFRSHSWHMHYMTKTMWTPARQTSNSKIMGINYYKCNLLFY